MERIKARLSNFVEKEGYRLILYKTYLDKGAGLTNYLKPFVTAFGVSFLINNSVYVMVSFFIAYAIFCFLLGMFWFKSKLIEQEAEVSNNVNPFVREMRKSIGIPNNRNI